MSSAIKIATLNLCLGLKNKKESVKGLILENEIEILKSRTILSKVVAELKTNISYSEDLGFIKKKLFKKL